MHARLLMPTCLPEECPVSEEAEPRAWQGAEHEEGMACAVASILQSSQGVRKAGLALGNLCTLACQKAKACLPASFPSRAESFCSLLLASLSKRSLHTGGVESP